MKKFVILLINVYKKVFSPIFESYFGGGCRFYPTCSQYTKDAINEFGVIEGLIMGTKRVVKCNPFNHKSSFYDPVSKIN